jgi:hypothetical protein
VTPGCKAEQRHHVSGFKRQLPDLNFGKRVADGRIDRVDCRGLGGCVNSVGCLAEFQAQPALVNVTAASVKAAPCGSITIPRKSVAAWEKALKPHVPQKK